MYKESGLLYGWGRYPRIYSEKIIPYSIKETLFSVRKAQDILPIGNLRSYGDSALNQRVLQMTGFRRFLSFDDSSGILHCESGVLLSDIIDTFLPRGWFLPVTPGTKFITVGGAVASDIHGKNHHQDGCFSNFVNEIELIMPDGSIKICSRRENSELFYATCGGMGLTGVILTVKFRLVRVGSSKIKQVVYRAKNLQDTFDLFEVINSFRYSVAWVDCLSTGRKLGRSVIMAGDFINDGDFGSSKKITLPVPIDLPGFVLNKYALRLFNSVYYVKSGKSGSERVVDYDTFFYPLDFIKEWNRMYGKNGFVQYQFILPKEKSYNGLEEILTMIARRGKGSFLAVLKLYGKENQNYLSFPMEGYSLALDFKVEKGLFNFLSLLDEVVVRNGGRIYLTKDSRMRREVFESGYHKAETFRRLRKEFGMKEKFNSMQSRRLDI
ncbi:MAG: FAD-binding protein [Candidatus Kryptoniota bacterium]